APGRPRRHARPPRRAAVRCTGGLLHDPGVPLDERHTVGMKRIALLGATGSIGRQALAVIEANDGLELVAATSGSTPIDGLAPLTQVGGDPNELLERAQPDVVLNATLGFAGLPATMWALEHGVTLALANKESLVAAGELALAARDRGGGALIPVDSEHSALYQCALLGEPDSLVLTASGGPFRGGASIAHLGYPDMRGPISFALTYPDRAATPIPSLDLAAASPLEFFEADLETFRMLALAREAGERGGTYPCVFNAANEVAVAAFLEGRMPFLGISGAVEQTLAAVDGEPARDLDDLVEADAEARRLTAQKAAAA